MPAMLGGNNILANLCWKKMLSFLGGKKLLETYRSVVA